jgi:hypothetical protein
MASFDMIVPNRQRSRVVKLWRRRVLPPGPKALCSSHYVRVRRIKSRLKGGPPAGLPSNQPSLSVAIEPENSVRSPSPLNGHFPRSQAVPGVVVWSVF